MELSTLTSMFRRSIVRAFNLKSYLIVFCSLIISGALSLIFQGFAIHAGHWLKMPLRYIPIFLSVGILFATAVIVIKLYHANSRGEAMAFYTLLVTSWKNLCKAFSFSLPLLVAFLLFWILMGIFIFLKAIPYFGFAFGIVLAFGPFLLTLATLFLFICALCLLFFVIPPFAIENRVDQRKLLWRLKQDLFGNLLLFFVALFPVWIVWNILREAVWMTLAIYAFENHPLMVIFQLFFIMLPLFAVLTPLITFFFNFAYEAFLWNLPEDNAVSQANASHL